MDSFKDRFAASLSSAKLKMEETKLKVEEKVAASGLSDGVTKLKESALHKVTEKKVVLESMLSALPTSCTRSVSDVAAAEEASSEQTSSDGEPATEKERLVNGELSSQGSRLTHGLNALGSFGSSISQLGRAGQAKVADSLEKAKTVGQHSVGTVSAMGSSGVEKLRSASSSGVEKLVTASAEARGRCGEAMDAASAMSGVNLGGSTGGTKEDDGLVRVCKCCPPLTFKQRVVGAFVCLALGAFLSLGSLTSLAKLLLGNPIPFAFKYTLGNLLSLGATSFLVGPLRQCRDMMAPSRKLASLVYFFTLVGTLLCIFVLHSGLLSLLFIVLQFVALTWYVLSYIPYGQTAAKSIVRRVLRRVGLLPKSSSHKAMPLPPV